MDAAENQIVVYQPNETVRLDVRLECCQCENVALLAQGMYLRGYIEHVGSGTGDIIEKCRESGLPPPQWEAEDDLSDAELKIVSAIRGNPRITRTVIAASLGITLDGVRYHLKALRVKLGLHHEGPTKTGWWVFEKEGGRK